MKDLQFGGNMYIVLVYDISQSEAGQKRWSRIFKICKKYLSHIQNSVFEGEISKPQLMQLKKEMQPYINEELDSIIIFKSRQENKFYVIIDGEKDVCMDFLQWASERVR